MISFQEYRPKPEVRESYTDQRVAAAVARATGETPAGVAAVEAAVGMWERAFASARSETLTAAQLALIGRSLLLRGESVWHIGRGGRLAPASHPVTVQGGLYEGSWTYKLTLAGPTSTRTVSATAGTVAHFRIGTEPGRPWAGCSPLANAKLTRDALAFVERSLSQEHQGPVGSMIAVQDPESNTEVATSIGAASGAVLLGESAATGVAGDAQRNDWDSHRFGPNPSQSTVLARDNLERAVWSAAGVPVELLRPSSGVDAREAWRRFLFAVITPLGAIVSGELRRLGLDPAVDWTELRASDLASRSRSYKQLTEAGVAAARAEELCGFN